MKKKDILLYLSSFILLGLSFIMFIVAFMNVSRIVHYVISGTLLIAFCIVNKLTEKSIRCNDGYNLLQAYFFYKKCEKNGVSAKVTKLKPENLVVVLDIANSYDYSKNFNETQIKELYRCGRETASVLEKTKGRK